MTKHKNDDENNYSVVDDLLTALECLNDKENVGGERDAAIGVCLMMALNKLDSYFDKQWFDKNFFSDMRRRG